MYVYKDIGNRINYYRKRRGYNHGEFSKLIPGKRTQSWISSLESGRKRISVDELGNIAEALGVSINSLLGDSFQKSINEANISIRETVQRLEKIIPTEFPCYLQSELGTKTGRPLMLEYSSIGNLTGSNLDNQIEDSLTVDILNLIGNFGIHKQIEKRNGLTFMRIKKRKIL